MALSFKTSYMKRILFSLILFLGLSSCSSRLIMKQSEIEKFKLTESILSQVQLFNSHYLVLTRYEKGTEDQLATKGKVNLSYGQEVDQVLIKDLTKGKIIKFMEGNRISVAFEPDESKYLIFGPNEGGDIYFLQALSWENSRGKIQYGDKIYYTNPDVSKCSVFYKLKKEYRQNKNVRTAKGNKV